MRLNNADILAMYIGGEEYTSIKQFANALLASNNLVADVYIDRYLLFSCRVHAYVDHDYVTIPVDGRFALKNSYIANSLTIVIKEFGSNIRILETHTLTNVLFGTCDYDADLSFKVLNIAPYSISKGWIQESEFHPLFSHKMNKIDIKSQPSINDGIDVEPGGGGGSGSDDTGGEIGGNETGENRTISWRSDDRIKSIKFIANNEELPISNNNSITVNSNTGTVIMIVEPMSGLSIDTVKMGYGDDNYIIIDQSEMSADGYSFELPINADVGQDAASIEITIEFSGGINVELPNALHANVQSVTNSPIAPNSSFTFRAIPDEGYKISSVTVDGNSLESDSDEYTITDVTASPNIVVTSIVDTNKFYSNNKSVYRVVTEDGVNQVVPATGRFKINLNNVEDPVIKEELQQIISDGLEVFVEQYTYTEGDPHYTVSNLVYSNIDDICEEHNLSGWSVSTYNNGSIKLSKDDVHYDVSFYYDGATDPARDVAFYSFDNGSVLPWHNYYFAEKCDDKYSYYYDSANLNEEHEYVSDADWGDTHDTDSMSNIFKISLSNIDQEIASNTSKFYSNGIYVYDTANSNSKHYSYYMVDLETLSYSEQVKSLLSTILSELVFVVNNYYYSAQAKFEIPVNNIESIKAKHSEIFGLSLGVDSSLKLTITIELIVSENVNTYTISIPLYVEDVPVPVNDQEHQYAFYYTATSSEDIGEYDRTNEDIVETTTGYNSGEGKSAYEFSFRR